MSVERVKSTVIALPESQDFERRLPGSLPLHLTILPEFTHAQHASPILNNFFRESAMDYAPLHLVAGEKDYFGNEHQIIDHELPVRRIIGGIGLKHLHMDMLAILQGRPDMPERPGLPGLPGVMIRNPQWIGEAYNPHISYDGDEGLEEGEEFVVDRIYFLQSQPNTRKWSLAGEYRLKER